MWIIEHTSALSRYKLLVRSSGPAATQDTCFLGGAAICRAFTAFVLGLPEVTNFEHLPKIVPFLLFLEDVVINKKSC